MEFNQIPLDDITNGNIDIKKDLETGQISSIISPTAENISPPTSIDDRSQESDYEEQTSLAVLRQMGPSFMIAGFGSVFAGIVLNAVTQWSVFESIPQFEIMVSAFIGLIGNIETTLASRLSTQANLGRLDSWDSRWKVLSANMLVVQCQSSTVGLFAAAASLLMSTFTESTRDTITIENIVLLCSCSIISSVIANTILAILISIVILMARKFRINPGKYF